MSKPSVSQHVKTAIAVAYSQGATSQELEKKFGVKAATIRQWAARGGWTRAAILKSQLEQLYTPNVTSVTTKKQHSQPLKKMEKDLASRSSQIVAERGNKSRLYLSKAVLRQSKKVSRVEPTPQSASWLKTVVDSASKLHGWGADGASSPTTAVQVVLGDPLAGAKRINSLME